MLANALTTLAEQANIHILQRQDLPGRAARYTRFTYCDMISAVPTLSDEICIRGFMPHFPWLTLW